MDAIAPVSEAEVTNADDIDRTITDWYKDAIIYQLHIKAFMDGDNNGYGDFAGLLSKLDYVQALGVTAIWLLPFYPSPLRDDGYDIADYTTVNPQYGDVEMFAKVVKEAHSRGLRIITELVINHTSDQHPWFQAARNAPKDSPERDMYVWSDTDDKYNETRIIFLDTEKSNWTWDPVAEQYFWHRFYSHQPDLNFDNPKVLEEVLEVMNQWLDMGVDGLRLDAIPYLVERDGTNNENLPETHVVLKDIRRALDSKYTGRMLLAEANQWPEDTRPYFGEGDECHMGFHFPLMPRMYMALAQEDRHPITDIIRQTPEIPEESQWAIFLRNHDELTLEMVTEEERDYLWRTYAPEQRARINLGIRRRLAPLLQNDRRKIELMNGFLLSMPGTPVMYYGDEIGMGDNYFLGDRDGVRTPMQWSADRNGGFSRANPQQLYLPPVMDPVYGFQAVNVEAQEHDPSSLLNWMRRIIMVRKQHEAFGRGTMTFIYPRNRKIIAYVREYKDEAILCVANLSRSAQAVELDLAAFRNRVPVELSGNTPFPPVGDLPYMLTLPAYGFFWFLLAGSEEAPRWHATMPEMLPDFLTLTARNGRIDGALDGREKSQLEEITLPQFLPLQRWFQGKGDTIKSVKLTPLATLDDAGQFAIAKLDVAMAGGAQTYLAPLSVRWGEEHIRAGAPKLSYTLAKVRSVAKLGALLDGTYDEALGAELVRLMQGNETRSSGTASVRFTGSDALSEIGELAPPRPLGAEQTNVSIVFGEQIILKIYRRIREGEQPDVEIARQLTDVARFENTPALLGTIELTDGAGAEPAVLAAAFKFVPNQGDAWAAVLDALVRHMEGADLFEQEMSTDGMESEPLLTFPLEIGEIAGQRTAEMHLALANAGGNAAFEPEAVTGDDLDTWADNAIREADEVLARLSTRMASLPEEAQADAEAVLASRDEIAARYNKAKSATPSGTKTRIHGDYHLGQVLVSQSDLVIIDFEGEPARTLEERRAKSAPMRDVAGMLRSFDYAAAMALARWRDIHDVHGEEAREKALAWRDRTRRGFLASYLATMGDEAPDADLTGALLDLFTLHKAIYEIGYELANRPTWVRIPLAGVLDVLADPRGVSAWADAPTDETNTEEPTNG
ncbi:maltose alpha-D-glucosyltransferase [Acuticoccus sp. MNP-M23]|uniref:maltose alpha-D-glucosyltransferase n=1 Tax=Acuticoccus sp. MNP-M23 TaxID=3072793 RepID=UPI002815C3BC|nr:maltose alpha-D-glucosyltransferase [Acuticoccus sp. MNP-M23]WMS40797.1 maltose alpha-D-glucosyltransferase [Acuticoccus sp. MNP-M23]